MPRKRTNKQQSQKTAQGSIPPGFTLRHTLRGYTSVIFGIAWSLDGRVLASGSFDNTIRLWDGQAGRTLQTLKDHSAFVIIVAWSPDGKVLASGSVDNTIRLWDAQEGRPLRTLEGHTAYIKGLSFSWDNHF